MSTVNKIHGGLAFAAVPFGAIETIPLPTKVFINTQTLNPLLVSIGDNVLKGQPISAATPNHVACHASISGAVTNIQYGSVTIDSDGTDRPYIQPKKGDLSAVDIQAICHEYGLVGLGGAAFPVDKKLALTQASAKQTDTLLINAAECDPAIYCDEALMQERPEEIVKGIELAFLASGAKQCIVGIEENKTLAIEALNKHLPAHIRLVTVPAIYPSGAENKLFALCTGRIGGLKNNHSLCFNVATCYSIYQASEHAQPLISRIVTVVNNNAVRNFELRLGTPISDIQQHLDSPTNLNIVCGGQMMGWPVTANHAVDKRTNSLIFKTSSIQNAVACIRCGACADVCPENLLPQQLFWYSSPHNRAALENLDLKNCIECACCDIVCPSHISLTQHFIDAKNTIRKENTEQKNADLAKERYEKREQRLQNQTTRARRQLDKKSDRLTNSKDKEQLKKDLIAKALQRKKNKQKNKPAPGNPSITDSST